MEMLSSKQKTAIIIAGVIVVGIFIFYMTTKSNNYITPEINEIAEDETKEEEEEQEEKEQIVPKEIVVHITGAVQKEGIVRIKEGSRIVDAIEAAGGMTDEINLEMINLAYTLKDGQKIYVPKLSDKEEEKYINGEKASNIIIDNGAEENSGTNAKININTANITQLESISGIGESTANKIIQYREKNGKFKTIEEIKNVNGIGDKKYEELKTLISIE